MAWFHTTVAQRAQEGALWVPDRAALSLGDVVCSLPAAVALKARTPK